MRAKLIEAIWIEEQRLSFAELADLSGLPAPLLHELVQGGAIETTDSPSDAAAAADAAERRYGASALSVARRARRLREDFELDASALLLVLGLMERLQEMEARFRELQAQLPRRVL